jgi:sec-independent protein translocase protein TatB
MFDVNGWELILLIVVGILVLGPERLPEYASKLAGMVRQVRNLATNARSQLKEQMGPEFEDVNWRQFDPRQYDPRRIVREALLDDPEPTPADAPEKPQSGVMEPVPQAFHDPSKPTPWDADAT